MSRRRRKANVSIYERPFLQRPAFFQRQALFWSMRPDLASKACMDVQYLPAAILECKEL
jgi:hypothetical protein